MYFRIKSGLCNFVAVLGRNALFKQMYTETDYD